MLPLLSRWYILGRILSKEIRRKVSQLLRLIVETGMATATANVITLILLTTAKWTKTAYIVPITVLSKVYGNAMLVLLNNCMTIPGSRRRPPTMDVVVTNLSSLEFQTGHTSQHTDVGVCLGQEERVSSIDGVSSDDQFIHQSHLFHSY
ncbi:hypothetical protein AMATHDRAFT_44249 [Amanita thiersii Skay4041]|uniref:DUF6534 domain-containing protein n=1 Tax=Amanita thiersii Skay4041 TaxID=703135 RepID=A0A2A9NA02_9AGAR|nr:hypothetical protein AMATHDRAFT_44249 [Amanita thiersii Skay4041]